MKCFGFSFSYLLWNDNLQVNTKVYLYNIKRLKLQLNEQLNVPFHPIKNFQFHVLLLWLLQS